MCKAILFCEDILTNDETGQVTLVGILNELDSPGFPSETIPLWVYLQLVDGPRQCDLYYRFDDLVDGNILATSEETTVVFEDHTKPVDVRVWIGSIPIPHPGPYDFVFLLADGQEVDRQRIMIHQTGD